MEKIGSYQYFTESSFHCNRNLMEYLVIGEQKENAKYHIFKAKLRHRSHQFYFVLSYKRLEHLNDHFWQSYEISLKFGMGWRYFTWWFHILFRGNVIATELLGLLESVFDMPPIFLSRSSNMFWRKKLRKPLFSPQQCWIYSC